MQMANTPLFIALRYFWSNRGGFRPGLLAKRLLFCVLLVLPPALVSHWQAELPATVQALAAVFPYVWILGVAAIYLAAKKRRERLFEQAADALTGQNFIRILSNLSMFGVAVGTAALVVVLSVFNGLETLTKTMFNSHNPEIKVSAVLGKSFAVTDSLLSAVRGIPGVASVTEVVEDNAYIKYGDNSMVATVKGVSGDYLQASGLAAFMVEGSPALYRGDTALALVGLGVQYELSVVPGSHFQALQIWYPRRGRAVSMNPERDFSRKSILPGGSFAVEQHYDLENLLVPLEFMEDLTQYVGRRTSLEVRTENGTRTKQVQAALKNMLGSSFKTENAEEQQVAVLRAVKIEKLFGLLTFVFVLGLASFNVFFSLALQAIDKKKDVSVLFALGAGKGFVRRVFLYEGAAIALSGALLGLAAGFTICWLQQSTGFVKLGAVNTVVDAYPVEMRPADFVVSALMVMAITFAASYLPAQNAANTQVHEHL